MKGRGNKTHDWHQPEQRKHSVMQMRVVQFTIHILVFKYLELN